MDTLARQTLKRFEKAVQALERAVRLETLPDNADRDAVLLRFELAAELMPKAIKRVLAERGAIVALPKDIVRAARGADLVSEQTATILLAIIDDRNRMVHDYSEDFAVELAYRIQSKYAPALRTLTEEIKNA